MTLLDMTDKKKTIITLFFEFFKIASYVLGGGFAILVVAEDVFSRKLKWLKEGELSDMLAIIQTVPGLTAGNIAIYVGYRTAGFPGALASLAGVALPSFLIITLISIGFGAIPMENKIIQGVFIGVRTAMAGLTLVALLRVWKGSIRDGIQLTLFLVGVLLILGLHLNPGWLIGGGLLFGPLWCLLLCRKMPKATEIEP